MDHEQKLALLRDFSDLQGECSQKAALYNAQGKVDLSRRFHRASLAGVNARMLIHPPLMAEREAPLQSAVTSRYETRQRASDRGS